MYIYKANQLKGKQIFVIIACLHAVLFRALANPYNYVDTLIYTEGFEYLSKMSFQEAILELNYYTHWGSGYLLLNWLISRFTDESIFLFIIASIISIIPVFWFYYKSINKILFPIIIFLIYPMMYYMGFGVIRQHLSVAFILLALYYFENKKISILYAIISASMHTSGIVFFPFFLWSKINFNKSIGVKFLSYTLGLFIFSRIIMGAVLSYMPKYEEIVLGDSENNLVPAIWFSFISASLLLNKIYQEPLTILEKNIISFFLYGNFIALFSVGLNGMGRFTICFLYVLPVVLSIISKYKPQNHINSICWFISFIITLRQLYFTIGLSNYNYDYSFFWEPSTL